MNLTKWRIRKNHTYSKWVVLAPGQRFQAEAMCDSFADAIQFLAIRQRWMERGFR